MCTERVKKRYTNLIRIKIRGLIMKIMFKITLIVVFMISLLFGIAYIASEKSKPTVKSILLEPFLTKKVKEYEPLIEKYAKKHGVENHVDTLLAMMMQESGGRGNDPMQSSESLCGEIGCIDNPEESIDQGVSYFAKNLKASDGDVRIAVQSYNFGLGFAKYVKERNEGFTQKIAIEFSQDMYNKAKDKSIYTCLRKEAKEYDACYGDIYYARDVMEYKKVFAKK